MIGFYPIIVLDHYPSSGLDATDELWMTTLECLMRCCRRVGLQYCEFLSFFLCFMDALASVPSHPCLSPARRAHSKPFASPARRAPYYRFCFCRTVPHYIEVLRAPSRSKSCGHVREYITRQLAPSPTLPCSTPPTPVSGPCVATG